MNTDSVFQPRLMVSWQMISLVGLLGAQIIGLAIWATTEHDSRVELERRVTALMTEQKRATANLSARIDSLDNNGSRGMQGLSITQGNQGMRLNNIDERLNLLSNRLTEISTRLDRMQR